MIAQADQTDAVVEDSVQVRAGALDPNTAATVGADVIGRLGDGSGTDIIPVGAEHDAHTISSLAGGRGGVVAQAICVAQDDIPCRRLALKVPPVVSVAGKPVPVVQIVPADLIS